MQQHLQVSFPAYTHSLPNSALLCAADFGITPPTPSAEAIASAVPSGRGWSGLAMPEGTREDSCVTQAGLMLGRSCRVGWSPLGFYAHAGVLVSFLHIWNWPSAVQICLPPANFWDGQVWCSWRAEAGTA